jgi:hypothetical protein
VIYPVADGKLPNVCYLSRMYGAVVPFFVFQQPHLNVPDMNSSMDQKQPLDFNLRHDLAPWQHKHLDVPADPAAVTSAYVAWVHACCQALEVAFAVQGHELLGHLDFVDHSLSTYTREGFALPGTRHAQGQSVALF